MVCHWDCAGEVVADNIPVDLDRFSSLLPWHAGNGFL